MMKIYVDTQEVSQTLSELQELLTQVILGKREVIRLLLLGILADGHILIEDVPGVGKTTLAKALARSMDLKFSRIQFTPDLLPADILGSSVLNPQDGSFSFQPGPIFANLVLADEINRASPRTQSALLEAMNEGQVTIDGVSRMLPRPFFVIATQNPVDFQGTYPLPEAQLDRFLLKIEMGYPDEREELDILFSRKLRDPLEGVESQVNHESIRKLQRHSREVSVTNDVALYLLKIVRATRAHKDIQVGISPRGAIALFRAAQARAVIQGRNWVSPEDVHSLAVPVLSHRLMLSNKARYSGQKAPALLSAIVNEMKIPT